MPDRRKERRLPPEQVSVPYHDYHALEVEVLQLRVDLKRAQAEVEELKPSKLRVENKRPKSMCEELSKRLGIC